MTIDTRLAERPMWDWYHRYYAAVARSEATAAYCERLMGRNLCQHDFTEMAHLDHLTEVTGMGPGQRALDLGCGNGFIAEYLSDLSGARVVGLDMIPLAIQHASQRTATKRGRLAFVVGDMAALPFAEASFDVVVSVDTLYFTDLGETVRQMARLLRPGGRMGLFYAHGWEPWRPLEEFDRNSVHPDRTPLALALQAAGLAYTTEDYTQADLAHARRQQAIAEEMRAQFEAEGNTFLWESHHGEAVGVQQAIAAEAHGRYLYRVVGADR